VVYTAVPPRRRRRCPHTDLSPLARHFAARILHPPMAPKAVYRDTAASVNRPEGGGTKRGL